jgi:hypothetical protein
MKSRIQLAGVEYASRDMLLWAGDLPQISGIPGMRIVLNDMANDKADALQFKQVVLEIDRESGDIEQVIYVSPVNRAEGRLLVERLSNEEEGAESK